MPDHFRLSVTSYQGLSAWSWSLADESGTVVAQWPGGVDTSAWPYTAIREPRGYGQLGGNARLMTDVGDWLGAAVLGPPFRQVFGKNPVTVTLALPRAAAELLSLPLEAARVDGRRLHAHHVTLVTVMTDDPGETAPEPVTDRLRVLALFQALPGAPSLDHRRERDQMAKLLGAYAIPQKKAIEFRALQYGITSGMLNSALDDGPGWDIVHIRGYALPELLCVPSSAPDGVGGGWDRGAAEDIAELLDGIRKRVRLITIAPCVPAGGAAPGEWANEGFPRLAELADQLDCAVASFRFPVPDEFAFDYFHRLYDQLIIKEQPLATAAYRSLAYALATARSPLPQVSPGLFGSSAAALQLAAPDGAPRIHASARVPARFAARDEEMSAASAALAMWSGDSAILLYGVPGVGKTTCAQEIAYTRDTLDPGNVFQNIIWYPIPSDAGISPDVALQLFAQELDNIPQFPLSGALQTTATLKQALFNIAKFLENERYLIVLDNIDVLLTRQGAWVNDWWGLVIKTMTEQPGHSRLIMTSRRLPAVVGPRVRVLPLQPFQDEDALLIATRLDNLRALMTGNAPGVAADAGRRLARHLIRSARGHPRLLEFADAAAGDPGQLARLLAVTEAGWRNGGPFAAGSSDYVQDMERWTGAIVSSMTAPERAFFHVVSSLAEDDREVTVIAANWSALVASLCPGHDVPAWGALIDRLQRAGLAMRETRPPGVDIVRVHPVLADYGRRMLLTAQPTVVAAELAAFWARAAAGGDEGAALRAAAYLSRLDAGTARQVLDGLLAANGTPELAGVVASLEPGLRPAYSSSHQGPEDPDASAALADDAEEES